MTGIIVTGHGKIASEFVRTLHWFLGSIDNVTAVDFAMQEAPEIFEDHLDAALDYLQDLDRILILCDLTNGVPCRLCARRSIEDPRLTIISGVNLGMLLEAVVSQPDEAEKFADQLIASGREQIDLFRLLGYPQKTATE
ncbi:PTS sugar transporter subunit IIA [Erysipelotrichaceae bacterium 51-3]